MLLSKPATSPLEDVTDLAYEAALDQGLRDEFFYNPSVRATVALTSLIFWKRLGASHRYPEPKDLEQEVWIKLVRYLHMFKKESTFKTWVSRITRNLAIEEQRRQQKQPNISDLQTRVLEDEQSSADTGREALLSICLKKLSKSDCQLLECYVACKTLAETAKELNMKTATVHNRLKALRKKIRTLSEDD
jgi:RNA polymerase sigma factor (sigma-70 family)